LVLRYAVGGSVVDDKKTLYEIIQLQGGTYVWLSQIFVVRNFCRFDFGCLKFVCVVSISTRFSSNVVSFASIFVFFLMNVVSFASIFVYFAHTSFILPKFRQISFFSVCFAQFSFLLLNFRFFCQISSLLSQFHSIVQISFILAKFRFILPSFFVSFVSVVSICSLCLRFKGRN